MSRYEASDMFRRVNMAGSELVREEGDCVQDRVVQMGSSVVRSVADISSSQNSKALNSFSVHIKQATSHIICPPEVSTKKTTPGY
jgi:hypothetical protein